MIPLPRTAKLGMVGADIEAHARAAHLFLRDGQLHAFTQQRTIVRRTFGVGKRTLFKKAAQKAGLPQYGVVGPALYRAMGGGDSGAYDAYAARLLRSYTRSESERRVRAQISRFCLAAEANEAAWHYSQARPISVSVAPGDPYVRSDCSGYVIQAYHFARRMTGIDVPDPSKWNYTGYGNTDLHEDDHPRVSAPYRVGDLAHYRGHVTICRAAGNAATAIWSSHGSEEGPVAVGLDYRDDLRFVVRPPLIARGSA